MSEEKFNESTKVNPETDKALVIVHSEVQNLRFESNRKIDKVKQVSSGDWEVWLPYGTHILKLDADGFQRLELPARNYAAKRTYEIWLKATGFAPMSRADDNLYDVIFTVNADSVYAAYGTFTPTLNKDRLISFRLPKGDYTFRFTRYGYLDTTAVLSVSGSVQQEVILRAGQSSAIKLMKLDGIVLITSTPTGAEVLINGQKQGNTPLQQTLSPGAYQLEVRKNLFYTDISTFTVQEGKTVMLTSVLKPRFGYVSINSSLPGGSITLDGKDLGIGPIIKRETESAEHTVRITAELYHDHTETFILKDGEEKNINAVMRPAFGYFEINTTPEQGATVYIDGQVAGITPYKSDRLRSGQYLVKVTKKLYADLEESIVIQDNKTETRILALNKNFGELAVSANNCDIFLNDTKVGQNQYNSKLSPGNYKVKVNRGANYYPEEKDVYLMIGDKAEINFDPQPRLGQVSVLIEPIEAADAEVYINNEPKGNAPVVLPLIIGNHLLVAKKANYLDVTQEFTVAENQKQTINLNMLTYEGSRKQVRDAWGKWKWIGVISSAVTAGVSGYFYLSAEKQFENYQNTTSTADAANYRKLTNSHKDIAKVALSAAGGIAVASLIVWIVELNY